jgi:hypothetical protein
MHTSLAILRPQSGPWLDSLPVQSAVGAREANRVGAADGNTEARTDRLHSQRASTLLRIGGLGRRASPRSSTKR